MEETNYTLATWLEKWADIYKSVSVKEGTLKRYHSTIKLIEQDNYSKTSLDKIGEAKLQIMLNNIRDSRYNHKTYSTSTMKKVRLTLSQALSAAKRRGLIESNPAAELVLSVAPTKEILPLTHEEEQRIITACENNAIGSVFIFLLKTGLRMQEVINLKWTDYNPKERLIYIRKSKTKAGIRTVYLLKEAQSIIENQEHINDYIFNSSVKMPLNSSSICSAYLRIRAVARVPNFTTHVCRHTFVTRLCEKGVPAKAIAEIIGHAQAGYVLDIYAKMEQETLRKAIYALEKDEA